MDMSSAPKVVKSQADTATALKAVRSPMDTTTVPKSVNSPVDIPPIPKAATSPLDLPAAPKSATHQVATPSIPKVTTSPSSNSVHEPPSTVRNIPPGKQTPYVSSHFPNPSSPRINPQLPSKSVLSSPPKPSTSSAIKSTAPKPAPSSPKAYRPVSPTPTAPTSSRRDDLYSRYNAQSFVQLKAECNRRQLPAMGSKHELILRLIDFDTKCDNGANTQTTSPTVSKPIPSYKMPPFASSTADVPSSSIKSLPKVMPKSPEEPPKEPTHDVETAKSPTHRRVASPVKPPIAPGSPRSPGFQERMRLFQSGSQATPSSPHKWAPRGSPVPTSSKPATQNETPAVKPVIPPATSQSGVTLPPKLPPAAQAMSPRPQAASPRVQVASATQAMPQATSPRRPVAVEPPEPEP